MSADAISSHALNVARDHSVTGARGNAQRLDLRRHGLTVTQDLPEPPMTDTPLDAFTRSWTSMALAPQKLWQSINSGWSFGNVTINESNSSAPQTEQAILAQESYGRQIGKLLDAVDLLVKQQPDWQQTKAFEEVDQLKTKIDGVKHDLAVKRIEQLRGDLDLLRVSTDAADKAHYGAWIAALRQLLDDMPASAN
ncbi:hypothetical protein SBA_ch1_24920 [Sphingomonas bisphenolicum]|uniref:Uncharacterized protein n=2 Tax=Sphingomonas bisphenolicum TaxID=296544 RepID=A0ABM7G4P8_9SPHN|nr:hypothetical protein SBA_ch1_24920 [Sphingomonas bisphenolicum]